MQKFSIDDSLLTREYGIHIGRWEQYAAAAGLPFSAMWCEVPANSHSVLDNHPEVELAVVVGGDAVFTVNGEDTPAPAGSAILLTPGDRHVITAGDEPVRILSIYWLPGDAAPAGSEPQEAKPADAH